MPPDPRDLITAQMLACRIIAAGLDRVRRVVLIGSRANGRANPQSDFDLIVLLETATGEALWGGRETLAEKKRLQLQIGQPAVRTDLWVRTTDQYEEARAVVGAIESLIDFEGVNLYSRPLDRSPVVRRTRDQVRCQNVLAWIDDSIANLDNATASVGTDSARVSHGPNRSADYYATRSIQRSIMALCVLHQVRASTKHEAWSAVLDRLSAADPRQTRLIKRTLDNNAMSPYIARTVLQIVVSRLSADPGMRPFLGSLLRRINVTR